MINTYALQNAAPTDENDRNNEIFLIDGFGFIFRAYYSLPPMQRPDGTPVNAVYGFTTMLAKLINEMHVPNVAVILDAGQRTFRNDIFPEYKANRGAPPEDLVPQFDIVKEAIEAFSVPAIKKEGYEADDLIATYVKLAREQGRCVTIVSSDKDLMQLLDDGVRMFDPMKYQDMGLDEVMKKFGVTPDKVVDVQSLAGDSTDNIPGIPGIGVKTAALLVNEYGDLESVLERAGEVKQKKRRENLIEFADDARMSKQLVQLATDVPVDVKIEDLRIKKPDPKKLIAFLEEQGFRSLISRMERQFASEGDDAELEASNTESYELVQDEDTLKKWVEMAEEAGVVAFDTETTALTPAKAKLVGISLSTAKGNGCYIPLQHADPKGYSDGFDFAIDAEAKPDAPDLKQIPIKKAMEILKPMLEDESVIKIAHNAKFDMQMFFPYDINVAPIDDTMLISYVLDGTSHSNSMDNLAKDMLGLEPIKFSEVVGKGKSQITFDLVPLDKALTYAAEDADITLQLYNILKPRLAKEKMTEVYETIERPLAAVLAEMENNGIKVDVQVLKQLSNTFAKQIVALETEIYDMSGVSFNVASPKQLGEVLFETMGIEGGKKTRSGSWSTNVKILETLSSQGHAIADKVMEWRSLSKLKSTYSDALPEAINQKTGRIHTSYSMAGTSTGRLASSDPNLQNIPIRSDNGKKIRAAFIPEKGYKLLAVDYSQVELRLAAELGKIEALKQAFRDGVDIHSATASQVFNVPLEEMTSDIRRQAKAINFGIIYGISSFGLAKQLGISNGEAKDYIDRYMSRFPELKAFMEQEKEYARKHGYIKTFYGRKCFTPGINDKNSAISKFAERQAINAPLQGTAADIMKRAMIAMLPALKEAGLNAKMMLQVHDEVLLEVPEAEMAKTEELVKRIMQNAAQGIDVPLEAEAGWGENWAEAH